MWVATVELWTNAGTEWVGECVWVIMVTEMAKPTGVAVSGEVEGGPRWQSST